MPWTRGNPGWQLGKEAKGTLKASVPITRDAIVWAAGFFEGEACFKHDDSIEVLQVNREPLEQLLLYFGGSIRFARRSNPLKPNVNDAWRWHVSGSRGRGVIMTVYQFMSSKRKGQIMTARQFKRSRAKKAVQ